MDQETVLLKRTILPKLILEFSVLPTQIPGAFFAEVHNLFFKFICKFEEFMVAESACNAGDRSSIPGLEDTLEKGMATHSSILAWRIPWTEELGGLQSMGSQSQT